MYEKDKDVFKIPIPLVLVQLLNKTLSKKIFCIKLVEQLNTKVES